MPQKVQCFEFEARALEEEEEEAAACSAMLSSEALGCLFLASCRNALFVSSYEANRVLTPTVPKQQWRPVSENELVLCRNYIPVPKQQWRPVSENELAYTAASAQSWVHA